MARGAGKGKGLLRNWESGETEIFVKIKATIGTLLADLFGDQSDQAALLQHQALAQHKEYSTILFLLRTRLFWVFVVKNECHSFS